MLKKAICSMALFAAVISFAETESAPNYHGTPKRTILDYGPFTNPAVVKRNAASTPATGTCGNPAAGCLFYGGDFLFDPFSANVANGLANESTSFVPGTPYGAATWVAFTVPEKEVWEVTGLFTNDMSDYGVLDQSPSQPTSVAYWAVMQGVEPGIPGTIVASGTSPATSTPTGRAAFDLIEFTIQVTGLAFELTPGSYWMTVVPVCTNTGNPYCGEVFFENDVEYINTLPTNAYGPPEPVDASFFDSPYFGVIFDPTNGPLGACGGLGCDAFSAGVLGKAFK